ncbi:hypothetical protein ABFT89_01495 [Xanthomonas campestris pv. campestris]|uniref:hypothetical protein n=1 Tax=Xanthomonas campestris TaxID=339 RepID=UPI00389055AC
MTGTEQVADSFIGGDTGEGRQSIVCIASLRREGNGNADLERAPRMAALHVQ